MRLEQDLFGGTFRNPVMLASGTCGFGREILDVTDVFALGGFVTKSVTAEPRGGNPPPRVAEFSTGMVNSVGLANPGLDVVRREKLPWIRDHLPGVQVFISVAGDSVRQYRQVVAGLDGLDGFLGFELNLSCPNDAQLGERPFALDPAALEEVVSEVRRITGRPLLVKMAPNDPRLRVTSAIAEEAGADGLTLVNTLPGSLLSPDDGRPALGAGPGGVSGPALRPVALRAVREARSAVSLPLVGVGGISTAAHAVSFLRAGASLVQVGTASFADPRAAPRMVRSLAEWGRRKGIRGVEEWVGAEAGEEERAENGELPPALERVALHG